MNKLIEKWREERIAGQYKCSDELQAWMDGLWTKITDDPETWPEDDQRVMYFTNGRTDVLHFHALYNPNMFSRFWRPLIPGIDTPEQP